MSDKSNSDIDDPNEPPVDGPGTGSEENGGAESGNSSQDKPGGEDSDGKQSPK